MSRGKFIVIYGANNLGKTTQAVELVSRLKEVGLKAKYLKYPIYQLEPTGPRINAALRQGLNLSDYELQREFAQNRRDFQPRLIKILDSGVWVVAEDYKGTGIAWGITKGISLEEMERLNSGLYPEDLAILLDGERFASGIEKGHRHEDGADWDLARKVHRSLGKRYGWQLIDANQSKEAVSNDIWRKVKENFQNFEH
jgi:thymidylate kinase